MDDIYFNNVIKVNLIIIEDLFDVFSQRLFKDVKTILKIIS